MPIIRDSTKKLSDINQSNQFMASVYRSTDKVFSKYVPDGTVLYRHEALYGTRLLSLINNPQQFDFNAAGVPLGIPTSKIKNGVIVKTQGDTDFQNSQYSNIFADTTMGPYESASGLPDSFKLPKADFGKPASFKITVTSDGYNWTTTTDGSVSFWIQDGTLRASMSPIGGLDSSSNARNRGVYPIIGSITAY